MSRLPVSNSDSGIWGDILNDFLLVEHNADGTQKALPQSKITNLSSDLNAKAPVNNPTFTGSVTLPADPSTNLQAATKQYVDNTAIAGAPDATTSTKGIVQLTGDLAGTATAPTVPGLATKANDTNVVHLTGNETIAGTKTFSSAPTVPDSSFTQAKVTNLTTDLAAKETPAGAQAKVDTHSADTTAVHGIADTSLLESTTGSQAKVDTHANDATAAHAATAIAFTPAGTIAATDVQAAIEEVAAEAVGVALSNTNPVAVTDPAGPGTAITASRSDHVHPTTGLALTTHTHVYSLSYTWTVAGAVNVPAGDVDYINPVFVRLATGQTAQLVSATHRINTGTSATVKVQRNGIDVTGFTGISVTTTTSTTNPADVVLASGDTLAIIVTATSGTPQNLAFSLFYEVTA